MGWITEAKRPVVLAGRGVVRSGAGLTPDFPRSEHSSIYAQSVSTIEPVYRVCADPQDVGLQLEADVRRGLSSQPKFLPLRWHYDTRGQALFSRLGDQPEYYLRRAETEILVARAREVAAYLEPNLTTPFAVACVPDAAYAACRRAHGEAFGRGVVLVPYSTALPVMLALYALAARHGGAADAQVPHRVIARHRPRRLRR